MLKKAVSIFMVVVMLLSMSITSVVFADGVSKGSQWGISQSEDGYTTFSYLESENGFAGKLTADAVPGKIVIPAGASSVADTEVGGSYPNYVATFGELGFGNTNTNTFQANVYADGNTIVGFTWHYSDFLKWDADGKIYAIDDTGTTQIGTLERGRWHTVAVTIDSSEQTGEGTDLAYNTHRLYIDGVLKHNMTRAFKPAKHKTLKIGAYAGSGSGVIAVDDVYVYAGEYDATNEVVALVNNDERLTIDSAAKTIVCDEDAFADAASFNEAVKAAFDANYALLYDSALSTPATEFAYGVVAINSKNGIGYDYYTVVDKLPEPVVDVKMQIEEKFDDETIDAQLVFDNISNDFKYEYQGNLGGKSADDKALVISAIDANLASAAGAGKEPKIKLAGNGYDDDIVTVEADIYKNDIATESRVYMRYYDPNKPNGGGLRYLQIVKFQQNGQININNEDIVEYTPNRWYKVAATLDRAKHGFDVYINGKLAGFAAIPAENGCTTVANEFYVAGVYNGLNEDTNATTISTIQLDSITAVDNFRVYLSAYVPADDNAAITVGSGLSLSADTIAAEDYALLTAKQVMDNVTAPVECVIYADDTYTTELTDNDNITANSVLVSKSQSGEVFEYYSFNGGVGNITFTTDNGKITASVDATAPYMFIIAEYNGSNELLNIFVSEELDFAQINNVTIDYTAGNTYKAFVWTANHVPVRYVAY